MENILPCHPTDLPKLADKTILTLPITVSVAIPTERISFWQSSAFSISIVTVLGLTIPFLPIFIKNDIQHINFKLLAFIMGMPLVGWFLMFLATIYPAKKYPQRLEPNFFLVKKLQWKTIPIMTIESEEIILSDYFMIKNKILQFTQIEKFYSREKRKGIPFDGFLVNFKDEKLNQESFKSNPYNITNSYIVIGSHRIFLRELLNLMNTAHKNRMNEIMFLSMDNDDNLMDIGW